MRTEQFRQMVAAQPENELFRFSLARALEQEGQMDEAADHYRWCARKKADWMMPRILLGKLLAHQGKRSEARPVLEEALHLALEQHHEDPEKEVRALLQDLGASDASSQSLEG